MNSIAILGYGGMGQKVLQALACDHPKDAILVWDPDPVRRKQAESDGARIASSLETLLANPDVRVAFITSPNHTHFPLAQACFRAGKAVFLEKPMAETYTASEQIVQEAEAANAYLQVGFELRYSRLYLWVKEALAAGVLGAVAGIDCRYICSEFHGKGSWRNDPATGGSMFAEKLCHYIDLPRWWLQDEVATVASFSAPNVVPYFKVNDNYRALYRFQNGAVASIHFLMYPAESFDGDPLQNTVSQQPDDGHELRYLITGTKGAMETDLFRRRLRRWEFSDGPKGLLSHLVETKTWPEEEDHFVFHNTTDQARDVVRRVTEGLPPAIEPRDALATMAAVEATERATESREITTPSA